MTSDDATRQPELLILDGRHEQDQVETSAAGGSVVALTVPEPQKESGNEDTVAVIPYGPDAAVLVVADGAGGLPAGKQASLTAVTTLAASLQSSIQQTMMLRTAILNGVEAANEAVIALGNGSATTMTVVTIEGLVARSYQIGDSEALVVGQGGAVRAQTTAHSPTGFAVEAGFLDQRDALHHEDRHLVSNFVGTSDMRIDIGAGIELRPRDTVLLASDGLTDNLHLEEIVELARKGPLDSAMEAIVQRAARRMRGDSDTLPNKPDDLSVILFRKP